MRNFSKIGATALAMALSVTLVAPISASAEIIETYEYDASGNKVATTYTNEDTGESRSTKDIQEVSWDYDEDTEDDVRKITNPSYSYGLSSTLARQRSSIVISTNSYNESIGLYTTRDVAKFTNFKSNKKALKVKVLDKHEEIDTNAADEKGHAYDYSSYSEKDEKYTYYYRNVNDQVIAVTDYKDLPLGYDSASYSIRLYTKKAGKYKFSYDAVLKNGTTVTKTINVIAQEDGNAIKKVTFGGNVIDISTSDNSSISEPWTKGYGRGYTTAKSGKIKVEMNKNFKLKKIEVGTPVIEQDTDVKDAVSYRYKKNVASSLEKDDYDDATISWKTVKNGKKIKLSNVDEDSVRNYTGKARISTYTSTATTTYVRVTYFDKKNKTTHRRIFTINKVKK